MSQIIVDNNLDGVKGKTFLSITHDNRAVASPELNAEIFARTALSREHAHPTPNPIHIKILTLWLRLFEQQEKAKNEIAQPTEQEVSKALDSIDSSSEQAPPDKPLGELS